MSGGEKRMKGVIHLETHFADIVERPPLPHPIPSTQEVALGIKWLTEFCEEA